MKWIFRSLPKTIYFNFHYLPFHQAIKLPILLYKPHFVSTKGTIKISGEARFGLIQLGKFSTNVHPNDGIHYENRGGEIVFQGRCSIGNSSYLSVGPKGYLEIGGGFTNGSGIRIVCFKSIKFGLCNRIGWGVKFMDTNFHPLIRKEDKTIKRASGPIEIGDYNWFGTECLVMHSVKTPPRCIFGARTTVSRNTEMESYCVTVPSSKGMIVTKGVYRDIDGLNDMDKDI
ncbi:MAG: hypothetical protein NC548_30085 [Lachnospiraceae bacterium]|nr:hypothetical protein [Lachnospiraceae bacterium]